MTFEELSAREDVKTLLAECTARGAPGKRLRPIETSAGVIVLQSPSRAQWNIFMQAALDDDKGVQAKAIDSLVVTLCLHPDKPTLANWMEDFPGMLTDPDVVKEIRRLCGSAKEVFVK